MTDTPESFALYLSKLYLIKRDFREGSVKEAEELFRGADIVLSKLDGINAEMICVVDGITHPGKIFSLTREQVIAIGEACASYTGKIGNQKVPVRIIIIEVSDQPITPEQRARLKALKTFGATVQIIGCAVDATGKKVEYYAPPNFQMWGMKFIADALTAPRLAPDQMKRQPAQVFAREQKTFFLFVIMAILAAMFAAEHFLFGEANTHGFLSPGLKAVILMGGLSRYLVLEHGEWFRLLTAPLLHGNLLHIGMNMLVLWVGGGMLVHWVGRRWTLAIYMLGALGGSIVSLLMMPREGLSVGASGAIMAVVAAAFVLSGRLRYEDGRERMRANLIGILVPALIPIAIAGLKTDVGAHIGGILTGAGIGFVILNFWKREEPIPRHANLAAMIGIALVLLTAYAEWLNISRLLASV